jgi:hypothetical protein
METVRGEDNDGDDKGDYAGDVTVVKMTLNALCMDASRKQICSRIKCLVYTMNQVVAEAYLFANFHVTRCMCDPTFNVAQLPIGTSTTGKERW